MTDDTDQPIDDTDQPIDDIQPETEPNLTKEQYKREINDLCEDLIERLAEDDGRLLDTGFDSIVAHLQGMTSMHEKFPYSVHAHSAAELTTGDWSRLHDVNPLRGVEQQSLALIGREVSIQIRKMVESDEYTVYRNGSVYLRSAVEDEHSE